MAAHRLFFGLQPPPPVLARLQQAAARLQADRVPGGRPVPAEKLHLTLAFLGDVEGEDVLRRAFDAGACVAAPGFDFRLDHALSFGGRQPPWVFAGASAPFAALQDSLQRCLHVQGLHARDEARAFVPHVTWLRNARARLPRTDISPIAWSAGELALYDSRDGNYAVLERWPLREPEPGV